MSLPKFANVHGCGICVHAIIDKVGGREGGAYLLVGCSVSREVVGHETAKTYCPLKAQAGQ